MREERVSDRPRMDKLGVHSGSRVSVLGLEDAAFLEELQSRGADVSTRRRSNSDLIFFGLDGSRGLSKLRELERYLKRDGAVWTIFPRGRPELKEADVIRAGVAAGLVDNKVVRFSDTHTALRFVIPLARR